MKAWTIVGLCRFDAITELRDYDIARVFGKIVQLATLGIDTDIVPVL
ncbi:MAG: hypothetical protein AAFQ16_06910 [Pseudomonadota bacterium]